MPNSYTEYLLTREETPPWMKKANSSILTGMIGYVFDATTELLLRGVQSGLPNHPNQATDGLDFRGAERRIPRRIGESDPDYAVRLQDMWEFWRTAGSRQMLIDEIQGHLGVTGVKIVATREWDGVSSDPYLGTLPAWLDSGELDNWSRFWVYIAHTGSDIGEDGAWDSPGNWDDGFVWDFENFSWAQSQALRYVIDEYRAAHEVCVRVRFLLASGNFTDVDEWNAPSIALEFLPEA